ncbi:MAG: type II 3-dehydroquinate dehydratase [Maricaulaceae bacterium]|jgi:3-dehydroquinate dehydratase-2
MSRPIFILNGPNLNRLGAREPEIYGSQTLDDVRAACAARAKEHGREIDFRQSNLEGELVTWIQEAADGAEALILNPAAYGHTSIALFDALQLVSAPIIEVHLSNPATREHFRRRSFTAQAANGVIAGLGLHGYELAIDAACKLADQRSS